MSFIKKLKNSKFFHSKNSSTTTINNNNFMNNLNIDTTIISDTNTTISNPLSNNNNNSTILSNQFKTPNGTLNNHYSIDLKQRNLIIYHIDSETEGNFSLRVKDFDLGEVVLDAVCNHYGLKDYKEYFGLKYTLVDDNGDYEVFWLDPLKTILKQLKDTNNVLTFRVKHFPGKPQLIESEYVRYLIFLQIRNYFLKGDLQLSIHDENVLASYAVQASLGDYDPDIHHINYLNDVKFLSRKAIKSQDIIMEMHKQLHGRTPAEMELAFLEKASQFDTYGAELIVVKNSKGVAINFGVSHNGIITFLHGQASDIPKIGLYPWTQIGKISFEGRSLKVHAHTPDLKNPEVIKKHVMLFKCNSKRICKHLWKFILDQKSFFNFKCGNDVPKIKSSNRLFFRKSKFRYSGRCESELISQQSDLKNLPKFNISPISLSSTQSILSNSDNNNNNFKRRTFLNVQRVTLAQNDNLLLMKKQLTDDNNNQDNINKINNFETGSQISQQTVITHNNSINNQESATTANTSTPETNKKSKVVSDQQDDEYIKDELYDTIEPFINIRTRNKKVKQPTISFTLSDDNINDNDYNQENGDLMSNDQEEIFYDPCDFSDIQSTSISDKHKSNGSVFLSISNQNDSKKKSNRLSSNIYFSFIGLSTIILLLIIFYVIIFSSSYTNLTFRTMLNYITGGECEIKWQVDRSSSTITDPIVSWFFSQYSRSKSS